MQGQITLTLLELRFFAYHGLYVKEQQEGQYFLVDLWITYPELDKTVHQLDQTLDYTVVFGKLKEQMANPRHLLEDLAQSILSELKELFPPITEIRIHIQQESAPVSDLDGRLGVQLTRLY
jgi:dihydroneopterin aldolase